MAREDDELPPEVQAQVDAALKGGDDDVPASEDVTPVEIPSGGDRPESRRERAAREAQERKEEIRAASARAEKAEQLAEEIRKENRENIERMVRMEQAITFMGQQRAEAPAPRPREDEGPSADEQIRKLQRESRKALQDGDMDAYEEAQGKMVRVQAKSIAAQEIAQFRQQMPQQQPTMQKPPWVTAVEGQFGDVMMHPSGLNHVAAFLQIDPSQLGAEKLHKAFARARSELGLGAPASSKPDDKTAARRAQLAGGPTQGAPAGRSGGGKSPRVNMPKGWEETAKRAGMPKEAYVKQWVALHPEDVVRE